MHSNEDDSWFITKRNGGAYGEVSVKKEHIYVVKRIYHQNKEKLWISRISLKYLDSMAGTQTATQKTGSYIYVKNREKSAVKYSIEKHVLIKFVDLPTIICPRLSDEKHFHF